MGYNSVAWGLKICTHRQWILGRSNLDSYDPEEGPVGTLLYLIVKPLELQNSGKPLSRQATVGFRRVKTPHEVMKIFGNESVVTYRVLIPPDIYPSQLPVRSLIIWGTFPDFRSRLWRSGWGTGLQTGWSRVRFPMVSLDFSVILPVALWP
jgi:hypothetical protein